MCPRLHLRQPAPKNQCTTNCLLLAFIDNAANPNRPARLGAFTPGVTSPAALAAQTSNVPTSVNGEENDNAEVAVEILLVDVLDDNAGKNDDPSQDTISAPAEPGGQLVAVGDDWILA